MGFFSLACFNVQVKGDAFPAPGHLRSCNVSLITQTALQASVPAMGYRFVIWDSHHFHDNVRHENIIIIPIRKEAKETMAQSCGIAQNFREINERSFSGL